MNSNAPFEGITVIELSTMITASFAAMMLAEQGARVIKVEPVGVGDPMRYLGTAKGGISALFANCNRGKESLAVDLKSADGQALVAELAGGADVLVHNYRPGVMDSLNLGSERLRTANPQLVYAAVSGFGTSGPLSSAPAYDPVVQAHAGVTAVQGEDGPAFIRSLVCDKITAYTICQGIMAALFQRSRSGQGAHLDLAMLDASLFFMFPDGFMNHTLLDDDVVVQPHLNQMYRLLPTADGQITISAATEQQMQNLLAAIGKSELLEDERFATMEARLANGMELMMTIAASLGAMTTDEAVERLREHDVPVGAAHSHEETLEQPQLAANGSLVTQQHPLMGAMHTLAHPVRVDGKVREPGGPAPAHGQHTTDILRALGKTDADIESLQDAGTVGSA